jgi:hypothetical protein
MAGASVREQRRNCGDRACLELISPGELARGVGATPIDHYVLWNGGRYGARPRSRCFRALSLVTEVGVPVPLRELILRAGRIEGEYGLRPEAVRRNVRQHQAAIGACYLLVRRRASGDFVSVTDVPSPAGGLRPLRADEVVLRSMGPARPLAEKPQSAGC